MPKAILTDTEFDNILSKLVKRDAAVLLHIPGIYEVVSEHYNNEVIEIWEQENSIDED